MSCGCNDTSLGLVNCNDGCQDCPPTNAVGLTDCPPSAEKCESIILADCVKYVGPNLPSLSIVNGMRLKTALVALNFKLTGTMTAKTYTITVSSTQTVTLVEYIAKDGSLQTKSVSKDQSPQTICAQENSPVKISGSGVISAAGAVC
jgi:hypothetical protein